jgi:hypothetical protein
VTAQTLVQYTGSQNPGRTARHPHLAFNGTTRITGVVFPSGTASVLFFGMTEAHCYGEVP